MVTTNPSLLPYLPVWCRMSNLHEFVRFELLVSFVTADKLYFDHNILSLKRLYSYNIGIFMYKYSKNMLPELFENFFSNVATIHEHNTRSACLNHIYVEFKATTRGQKAFSYSGARIWNFILSHIETDCAIGTFKKHFAKLLLNSKEDILST